MVKIKNEKNVNWFNQILSEVFVHVTCKYFPTCSQYAIEALEKYGVIKGGLLAVWRILRCNPFSKGGYDPVP
jgi:putative membrane protein insertion efficiency factor